MGELTDRRARKKAQTREQIREVARRLFADRGFDVVTIADVAREADVAVQTVFNHFATKEELFFDGRTPWVEGSAAAVSSRRPDVAPLDALRTYQVHLVRDLMRSMGTAERRCYIETLEKSEGLRVFERELIFEAERRLAAALLTAWTEDRDSVAGPVPADPPTAASLTAATWLAATRVLVIDNRAHATSHGADTAAMAEALGALAEQTFSALGASLGELAAPTGTPHESTGWPQTGTRRAG